MFPPDVRQLGDEPAPFAATSRDRHLVLERGGPGPFVWVDRRWRLALPRWLQHLCAPTGVVLVSVASPGASVVVVSPTEVVDPVIDAVVGGLAVGEVS